MGLVRPVPGTAATLIVVNVKGHLPQATAMLEKVSQQSYQGRGKTEHGQGGGERHSVVLFDVPAPKNDPDGGRRKVYYFLTGEWLGASDSLDILRGTLALIGKKGSDTLASNPGFAAVMQRCAKDAGAEKPQIRCVHSPGQLCRCHSYHHAAQAARKQISCRRNPRQPGLRGSTQGTGGFVGILPKKDTN